MTTNAPHLDPFDLTGRVAVVTGAARGIGRAAADLLTAAGAEVVGVDWHSADGVATEQVDVADQAAVDSLIAKVVEQYGRLDVMVNNAGVIGDLTPLHVTEAELDRVFAVNFKGTVFGSQAAAQVMITQGRGSIINFVSGAVDIAIPAVAAYAAAKAAAHQYSRSLALEVAPMGVRVNCIAPGWTDTPMNTRHSVVDGSLDPSRHADYVESRRQSIPLGITGEPIDQAYAVLYLASDASRFMTGNTIRPNGGMTTPW